MKNQYKSRTILLLMVLLSSLSTYAQTMVGDGFGGRAGYSPVNIAVGSAYGFAVCDATKQGYVWGSPNYARNDGSLYYNASPATVSNVSGVRQVSLTTFINTYIKDNGNGYVFGRPTPYNGVLITNAYYTACNEQFVAFVKADGTVWVGGSNSSGGYGNGTTVLSTCSFQNGVASSYCLEQMPGISNAKRVAVSGTSVAILLADGTVKMTGGTTQYMPAALVSTSPIPIPGLSNIVDIKSRNANFYALTASGQVYAWGNSSGMGTGVTSGNYMPTLISFPAGAAPIKAISANSEGSHALALDDNGNLYGWGGNGGNFGTGNTNNVNSPVQVATNVRDAKAGGAFSYIVKNDNTIWGSIGGNIFPVMMNLPEQAYLTFTQMNPSAVGLCPITTFTGMPPCVAGTTAPAVTPSTATNSCPATTVDLTSLAISSTTPSGAKLIWSMHKTPTSAGDTLTTAQKTAVSTAGKYYAMYYDAANACYSPADSIVVTMTTCAPVTVTNSCPTATVNLMTAITATNLPSGATVTWHTGTPATAANKVATPTAVSTSGAYYMAYYDGNGDCYSDASQPLTVTITPCVPPLTVNNAPAQTATTGAAMTGNAATELAPTGGTAPYVYSNGAGDAACVAPSGATLLTGLTVNSNGSYSYTAPTTAGTYYYCIKVCDSATLTASCVVKTYTLTVTAAASCTISNIMPTFIKN